MARRQTISFKLLFPRLLSLVFPYFEVNLQGVRQKYITTRAELSIFTLRRLGIDTENIPRAAQEKRSKTRHGREEAGPSIAASPPSPLQSNWQ